MQRIPRMFEIIQILRASRAPMSAEALGEQLEVSKRTIYRDIAALQAMRVPIEGEAGFGYVMRNGYDLPPLNFDSEEIEALRVGLKMLARTGDSALQSAASRIVKKIDALNKEESWLQVATWGVPSDDPEKGCISFSDIRRAIRDRRKLRISYQSPGKPCVERVIRPIAVIYLVENVVIAAWCELRGDFRHFRTDRIWDWSVLEDSFEAQADVLLSLWQDQEAKGAELLRDPT